MTNPLYFAPSPIRAYAWGTTLAYWLEKPTLQQFTFHPDPLMGRRVTQPVPTPEDPTPNREPILHLYGCR